MTWDQLTVEEQASAIASLELEYWELLYGTYERQDDIVLFTEPLEIH